MTDEIIEKKLNNLKSDLDDWYNKRRDTLVSNATRTAYIIAFVDGYFADIFSDMDPRQMLRAMSVLVTYLDEKRK